MIPDPSKIRTVTLPDEDPTAVSRKKDHIELAFKSRIEAAALDGRFYYEPVLSGHPPAGSLPALSFAGKTLRSPLWVSSMTGGTAMAGVINHNLARACAEFGMGLGLGSCRQLLYSDDHLADFDVRGIMGNELPLYANLGVAQLEQLLRRNETARLDELIGKLRADGLIVHINPMQEAMQPEGDFFLRPPLDTLADLLSQTNIPMIVKEVGQGMGPASLRALMQLPLQAIEFAAAGGTNFAKLELLRSDPDKQKTFEGITTIGHTAVEMTRWTNDLTRELGDRRRVQHLIISGGVQDFLDGYYLIRSSAIPAVYGQASGFLRHATGAYDTLQQFVQAQVRGLELAYAFLTLR